VASGLKMEALPMLSGYGGRHIRMGTRKKECYLLKGAVAIGRDRHMATEICDKLAERTSDLGMSMAHEGWLPSVCTAPFSLVESW